jgi:hypothetical protein
MSTKIIVMHIERIKLSKTAKDKLLKMAIVLFPEFTKITIANNGMVKFFRRGLFKLRPRVKIHYLDLCLEGIPKSMSRNRYANDDLTIIYYKKLGALLRTNSLNFAIDYLWDEFMKVKVQDVLYDLNAMLIPLPNGTLVRQYLAPTRVLKAPNYADDVEELDVVLSDGTIIRNPENKAPTITLEDIFTESKVAVATVALFITLNLTQVMATLRGANIFPDMGIFAPL